jgi:excisionase family DNA binding protein
VQRLLRTDEVAQLLQVPLATIYRWRYYGDGPRAAVVGRHLRWDPGELEAWVEAQKGESGTAVTGRSPNPSLPVRKGRSR